MNQTSFDSDQVEWRRITDPSCVEYKIDFEFSLMGFDREEYAESATKNTLKSIKNLVIQEI